MHKKRKALKSILIDFIGFVLRQILLSHDAIKYGYLWREYKACKFFETFQCFFICVLSIF